MPLGLTSPLEKRVLWRVPSKRETSIRSDPESVQKRFLPIQSIATPSGESSPYEEQITCVKQAHHQASRWIFQSFIKFKINIKTLITTSCIILIIIIIINLLFIKLSANVIATGNNQEKTKFIFVLPGKCHLKGNVLWQDGN